MRPILCFDSTKYGETLLPGLHDGEIPAPEDINDYIWSLKLLPVIKE